MSDVEQRIRTLTNERDRYRELVVQEVKRLETNLTDLRERIEAIDSSRQDPIGFLSEPPRY